MLERIYKTKQKISLRIAAGLLCCALFSENLIAASFSINYSGRLTRSDGSPVEGPLSIQVKFWNLSTDGAQIGQTLDYSGINLSAGVFALDLVFPADQVATVFGDGSSPVYIELTSQNITYPRQQFSYVPFALRVPVDSKMLTFDEDGKLTFTAGAKPGANQFLTTGTDGKLTWGAPAASTIQNQAIATGTPSSGQVLTYNGSQWTSSNSTSGNGSGSIVNLTTGVTGTLAVSKGGTGATIFANNGVLIGSGQLPISTATGSQYQVFTSGADGTLGFGAVNLAQSAAVSGVLPTANGGTGVNSTATFPVSGVVVTRDATETLTNKTITTATVNGNSTIGGSTEINTTGTVASGAATVFGNVTVRGNGTGANKLILNDKGSTNSVSFKAPDTLASSVTWELPDTDGSSGQVLATNGSGTLSWASGLAPTGAAGGDLTGAFPNPTLVNVGTAGAYSKVLVDSKGRVTSGSSLSASDIPNLSAAQITSGTLNSAQLPTAGTAGTYAKVTTDDYGRVIAGSTLSASDIPPISASLITSGTLDSALLPTLGTAGTYAKVTTDAYGRVTAGTTLDTSDITSSLGFTPINKAGDTMTGALSLGSSDLISAGNIQMAESKTLALSGNTADPTGLVGGDKGKTWFNTTSNQIKYWDGTTAQVVGAAGTSLNSLNGETGSTQTFAAPGTSGTAPAWVSAANAHTLSIPLASTASVTAGLISYSDFTTFNGKVAGVTSGTGVTVSSTGNIATVNLATAGTAGTYAKVSTDAYGRVTDGTTLSSTDIPPISASLITSGTLNAAQLPTAGAAGTYAKVTTDAYGRVTAGTTLDTNDITSSLGFTPINKAGDTMNGNLVLPINGLNAGTNQLVLANGNVGIGTTSPAAALDINGQIKIQGGTPGVGKVLTSDANGLASWSTGAVGSITGVTAGTGLSGGGTSGSITLSADVGTTANKLVQLDASAKLPAVDGSALTNLNPTNLSASVSVAKGGTGLSSGTSGGIPYFNATSTMASSAALTANGVVLGAGAGAAPTTTAAGAANTLLRVPSGGGAPSFGALDVSQPSSVTGALNLGNGGTGTSLLVTGGTGQYLKQTTSGAPVSVGTIAAADLPTMVGDSGSGGTKGAVPMPASGDSAAGKFLKADGSWSVPSWSANWAVPGAIGSTTPNSGAFTTLTTSGNVGIGTTSPDKQLDVVGNVASDNYIVRRVSDGNETTMSLASDASNYLRLTNLSGNRGVYINTYTADGNRDVFFAGSGGSVAGTPGIIRAVGNTNLIVDGNVGIGTTAPSQLLTVGPASSQFLVQSNGHIKTTQAIPPTFTSSANAGTGATCVGTNATDTAGNITLTTVATGSAAGVQCTVTFNTPYGVAPICTFTPTNTNAAAEYSMCSGYPITTTTELAFTWRCYNRNTIYKFSYFCIETN